MQLVATNHVLIDSLGYRLRGDHEVMRSAWARYFQTVPDYRIKAKAIFARGNIVFIVGEASGGYLPPTSTESIGTWRTPAMWRVRGRLTEWQVYADNEPIRELIRRESNSAV